MPKPKPKPKPKASVDAETPEPTQPRISEPGIRHRKNDGPRAFNVTPVDPPTPQQLGTLHAGTADIIQGGPAQLLQHHKRASKLDISYGEEFKDQWRLKTKWLCELEVSHRGRERDQVRYALMWRPTFLAVVALSYELILGTKAAGVSPQTVINHRKADPDFDAQVIAAQAHCIQLLHAVTMRRVIEGDCEPIVWQGIVVGYIRKFDGRLQLEMLRAHMPNTFKTPGRDGVQPLIGDNAKIFVCDAKVLNMIQTARQANLAEFAKEVEVGTPAALPVPSPA